MQFRKFATLVPVALLTCAVALVSSNESAQANSKKHSTTHHRSNYFVPPPPAYVPSILPERMINSSAQSEEADAAADDAEVYPYKKYIYTRQGYAAPRVVQPNKYVTYWNRS